MPPKNRGEDLPTLAKLGRLRPIQTFFQIIRYGRASPPIERIKGGGVFIPVLKKLLTSVLFAVTREVKVYFVSGQGAVEVTLKSIAKGVIAK